LTHLTVLPTVLQFTFTNNTSILDYRTEPVRLEELSVIRKITDELFTQSACQIWTGDFNALTQEDYSPDQWQSISNIRAKNSWESPQTALTKKVFLTKLLKHDF